MGTAREAPSPRQRREELLSALTPEERAEYATVTAFSSQTWTPIETRITAIAASVAGLLLVALVVLFLSIGGVPEDDNQEGIGIALGISSMIVFFTGLAVAIVAGHRTRKPAKLRARELLEIAAIRVEEAQANPSNRRYSNSERNRYPVTNVYDPATYYSRGGRATARGMAETGISDYDTYRNNVEERE